MKVTRLKEGYKIRCTDAEFAALRFLTRMALANLEGEDLTVHGFDESLAREIDILQERGALAIDENRRRDPFRLIIDAKEQQKCLRQ
jgi:hypothetical protein